MKNKRIKFIAIFIGLFLMLSGKVSAYEISQFCEYTEPCVSTEYFEDLIEKKGLDPNEYKNHFASYALKNTGGFLFYVFVYKDNATFTISINEDGIYIPNYNGFYYTNYVSPSNTSFIKIKPTTSLYTRMTMSDPLSFSPDIQETFVYYSNKDILDADGNIVLYRNDIEVPPVEPEEEPITIINKMALFVNDIVVYFNENNISFYQILIGLFIFNFLVYVICYIVRRF